MFDERETIDTDLSEEVRETGIGCHDRIVVHGR